MYLFRISAVTISRIVSEVCKAIYEALKEEFLKFPSDSDDWLQLASEFFERWNFPQCIGAIDGKHITMQAPAASGSFYFNYKGFHSIVLMALVDAKYRFTFVDVGCNGRVADGGIFGRCSLSSGLENKTLCLPSPRVLPGRNMKVPFVFVADDAFPLRENIMKPYPLRDIPGSMRIFNYRLSRARRIVENAFGIMSSVFRIFRKPIAVDAQKAEDIVLASCALHNLMITKKDSRARYAPHGTVDMEDMATGVITPGAWRKEGMPANNLLQIEPFTSNRHAQTPQDIRHECREYFLSPQGEVSWQYKFI
ncbi:putative nuclease HARBI1 [Lineus longissimus]|uniref:putative nuclease HARBI1 n=1 Tax=Lineus longissimus TaxID=88925 RepID=UPI00315D06D5